MVHQLQVLFGQVDFAKRVEYLALIGPRCQKWVLFSDSQETYDLMTLFRDPPLLWLLPAERLIGRVGFAATGDPRLSRHTGITGFPISRA